MSKEETQLTVVRNQITKAQQDDKKELFDYLDLSLDKYDMDLPKEVAQRYKQHVKSLRHGLHAMVPLVCYGGRKCPIGERCPFTVEHSDGTPDYDASTYPILKSCPIERDMMKLHMQDLIIEYNIGPDDTTDIAIISKLASLDVYEYRANMVLARDEGIVIDEIAGVNPVRKGEYYTNKKLHPAFELLEKIHRMKQDLLKSMVGTRESKVRAVAAGASTQGNEVSKTMAELTSTLKQMKEEGTEWTEDEGGFIDVEFEEADEIE